jgi:hypothetical protein
VDNADKMIRAMHLHGYQMGPLAAFGPHDNSAIARDAFDNFVETMDLLDERDPWYELR